MDDACPWEVTDNPDDMITYADFSAAWNFDGECPGDRAFSKLIQMVPRPSGGTVTKVGRNENQVPYNERYGFQRQGHMCRPFRYVRWVPATDPNGL